VPDFADIASRAELDAALARLGTPAILKTRRLGYDGKGQFRIRTLADADARGTRWARRRLGRADPGAFVPFDRELSVLAVRGRDGEFRTWPLTENWHEQGVLSASLAPARADATLEQEAVSYARRVAESLDYVGVFALELFLREGQPARQRDGAARAQLGPLEHRRARDFAVRKPSARRARDCRSATRACSATPACSTGSANCRPRRRCWPSLAATGTTTASRRAPGRKVGHATFRADTRAELTAALSRAGSALARSAQVDPVIARLSEQR
jgi:5-(carboxyamino)imidazole ribonucleotide synthase